MAVMRHVRAANFDALEDGEETGRERVCSRSGRRVSILGRIKVVGVCRKIPLKAIK